jgi:phosphoglycerate kinase
LFILGGNKLQNKIPFIKKFLEMADFVLVGGALANDFFKAQGLEIGESLVSQDKIVSDDLLQNKKIILPEDVIVKSPQGINVKKPHTVKKGENIVDVGPQTMEIWRDLIKDSNFALWNGPLGDYLNGFSDATFELIRALTDNQLEVIAGGGDTEHCISQLGLEEKFDFISTGGGALLEFVATGTLAGIEALRANSF